MKKIATALAAALLVSVSTLTWADDGANQAMSDAAGANQSMADVMNQSLQDALNSLNEAMKNSVGS